MTPNPNAYNITYDDGTVSPMLRLDVGIIFCDVEALEASNVQHY